jgi:hypothetical protein
MDANPLDHRAPGREMESASFTSDHESQVERQIRAAKEGVGFEMGALSKYKHPPWSPRNRRKFGGAVLVYIPLASSPERVLSSTWTRHPEKENMEIRFAYVCLSPYV